MSIDIDIASVNTQSMREIMACYERGGGHLLCYAMSDHQREGQLRDRACRYAKELRDTGRLPPNRFGIAVRKTFAESYLMTIERREDPAMPGRVEAEILKEFPRAPRTS